MAVKSLTINGKPVAAREGQTILDVASEAGIHIPTLCHMTGIKDIGACRLCMVEIGGSPRLQAACVTQADEGMDVQTDTPQLREYRKMIVELLFAEGNHVCSVCVANRHCELQDLAVAVGMDHVRYEYTYPNRAVDISHRIYGIDHNRCVLCQRCIRTCDEIEGAHVWDLSGRGANSKVISDMNQPWGTSQGCTSCGKCVQSCPTGALFRKEATVAEMQHDRTRLEYVVRAREKKQWLLKK